MNARATKSMWVTRCEHVGALIGGVLSLFFGAIGAVFRFIKRRIIELTFSFIGISCFTACTGQFYKHYHNEQPATPADIAKVMATADDCVKELLPRRISIWQKEKVDFVLNNGQLKAASTDCAEFQKKTSLQAEQMKAAGVKK